MGSPGVFVSLMCLTYLALSVLFGRCKGTSVLGCLLQIDFGFVLAFQSTWLSGRKLWHKTMKFLTPLRLILVLGAWVSAFSSNIENRQ
jgi:hypothetical protein